MQSGYLVFFSLTLFVGLSYAQKTPQTLELSANIVMAGDQLKATCIASNNLVNRILQIDGQNVNLRISSDRLSDSPGVNSTTWTIDPVEREDAGEYLCFVSSQSNSDESSLPQNVTVQFSPIATISVPPESVRAGESAVVVFSVSAVPEITTVQTSLPSEGALSPSEPTVGVTSVTVTFDSTNRYNNGAYTANFTNAIGSSAIGFQLTVYFGPYFSYEGAEQTNGASIPITSSEGDDFNIVCNVTSTNPAVSSLMLSMSPDASNVEFVEGSGTITITGARAANEGTYTCTADNGETTPTTISFVLTVQDDREPTTQPAPTTDSARNLEVTSLVAVVMLLATILFS